MLNTKLIKINNITEQKNELLCVAEILKSGGLVAIPTETVYGLAADCLNPVAVENIFKAKGRPNDNPLIVHLAEIEDVTNYAVNIPSNFYKLAAKFCPGPLTMILPKHTRVPLVTSGGLDTIAIRFPSHPVAREIIRLTGVGLAAPSANRSGSPSPTTAKHCIDDLLGRVDAIVDAGCCDIGVESTVVSLAGNCVRLLRPGAVTAEQLSEVVGKVEIDSAVTGNLAEGTVASSPGMKYKHYSPKAKIVIVSGDRKAYCDFVNSHKDEGVYALCFTEDLPYIDKPTVVMGGEKDDLSQAQGLFAALRKLDELGAKTAYARCPSCAGVGLAVYNRLLRAAAFDIIELT
ncbi:MAG: L-threonylcarbamoyladenylate synthase [Oscillospiraceae bacterium]